MHVHSDYIADAVTSAELFTYPSSHRGKRMTDERRLQVREALEALFREFYRVVSVTDLKNPPLYAALEHDKPYRRALEKLAATILPGP